MHIFPENRKHITSCYTSLQHAEDIVMQYPSKAQEHKFLAVRTVEGARTSISIPITDIDRYVAICYGSSVLFRRHLNAAVIETSVRPGRSRSEAVRVNLNRRMELVESMRIA
jgi:hypothetical protein